jgi:hypothetical protein
MKHFLDRIISKPDSTPVQPPVEVHLSVTDKGANALAWGASLAALFVSAAVVLISLFQKKDGEHS